MTIDRWITVNKTRQLASDGGLPVLQQDIPSPEALYTALECSYLKFFKMDKLSKWAWIGAEYLLSENILQGIDKNNVGVCLTTLHGCIDVDKRFLDGIAVASPALFVYTLPNIMLGELCIRHGFKGEQLCTLTEKFDAEELYFDVKGMLDRGMEACLCGWVDIFNDAYDICLFWVTKKSKGLTFTPAMMQGIYSGSVK